MADSTPKSYHTDPQLYLYTSLTSGSSQIFTATSRLQTILKANRIQFQALDVATDEKARMLWGRRCGKRKLPGLVRYGMIIGDLEQIEEWNEFGELKQNLADAKPKAPSTTPSASTSNTPSKAPPPPQAPELPKSTTDDASVKSPPAADVPPSASASESPASEPSKSIEPLSLTDAMRQVGLQAAKQAGEKKAQARRDFLEAAKAKDEATQKPSDPNSAGLLPLTSTSEPTEAKEVQKDETPPATKTAEEPATSMEDKRAQEAEENAAANIKAEAPMEALSTAAGDTTTDMPSAEDVGKKANEAIAEDEEEVLEGTGQVDPEKMEVPTAKEIEEKANQAIVDDEHSHVMFKGRGSVPHALSPEPAKKKDDNAVPDIEDEEDAPENPSPVASAPKGDAEAKQDESVKPTTNDAPKEKEDKKEEAVANEGEAAAADTMAKSSDADADADPTESETAKRQEGKVGVAAPSDDSPTDTKSNPAQTDPSSSPPASETAKRQEEKVGVAASSPPSSESPRENEETSNHPDHPEVSHLNPESEKVKSDTAAATGIPQALPGSKIQEEPAAAPEKVAESVGD